jgi:hypothetical protein
VHRKRTRSSGYAGDVPLRTFPEPSYLQVGQGLVLPRLRLTHFDALKEHQLALQLVQQQRGGARNSTRNLLNVSSGYMEPHADKRGLERVVVFDNIFPVSAVTKRPGEVVLLVVAAQEVPK